MEHSGYDDRPLEGSPWDSFPFPLFLLTVYFLLFTVACNLQESWNFVYPQPLVQFPA